MRVLALMLGVVFATAVLGDDVRALHTKALSLLRQRTVSYTHLTLPTKA